jgi:hypothetical protein
LHLNKILFYFVETIFELLVGVEMNINKVCSNAIQQPSDERTTPRLFEGFFILKMFVFSGYSTNNKKYMSTVRGHLTTKL